MSIAPTRSPVSPDALLDDLDPEQRQVATALSGPVAVIAGAGTGKTRAITYRIAYGVASGVYNPTSVLAVTFTTRAAGELRSRLQGLGARGVQARTFHSAALRQAQYFWPQVYGGELPHVPDGITDPDARNLDWVWMQDNVDGVTTERWFHAAGCRRWVTLRRNTTTDRVVQ